MAEACPCSYVHVKHGLDGLISTYVVNGPFRLDG